MSWRVFIVMLVLLLSLTLTAAQGTDQHFIEGQAPTQQRIDPFSCAGTPCQRITDLLFPQLLHIDPESLWLIPADETNGLVSDWMIEDDVVTYTLAEDRSWSDGTPITAYDVFYSYRLASRNVVYSDPLRANVVAAAPLDERTIRLIFDDANCDTIPQVNFPVIPMDAAAPTTFDGGDLIEWYTALEPLSNDALFGTLAYLTPTLTSGPYQVVERRFGESIHLRSDNIAYSFLFSDTVSEADLYLRGETNLIIEPPYDRRDDLLADDTSRHFTAAGNRTFFVALNPITLTNDGEAITHPILSDPAVRTAMQRGLDVQALIDAGVEGYGVPLAVSLPPEALGFDPTLSPTEQDIIDARKILHDAGWRDVDGDLVRECSGCATANAGAELQLTLHYRDPNTADIPPDNDAIARLMRNQFTALGISVDTFPTADYRLLTSQNYDMLLLDNMTSMEARTIIRMLATDDELLQLLDEAANAPMCDTDARRELYRDIEALLQTTQPHLWLFSPERMIVTRQLFIQTWEGFLR